MTLHDRIALRAYFAWLAAGRPDGQHETHWLSAECFELTLDAEDVAAAAIEIAIAKRSAAARKAAATRKANRLDRIIAAEAATETTASAKRVRRATAH